MRIPDERGSVGTLMMVGMLGAVAIVFAVGAVLINWFSILRDAEQSAELAALAAVSASVALDDPCEAAAVAAERNGAIVHGCTVRGGGRYVVVEVTVVADLKPTFPLGPTLVERSATAGTG